MAAEGEDGSSSSGYKKHDYKVVLAGMYGVGKTSIFRAMFNYEFCNEKPPSALECATHKETFADENTQIGLNIWDTVDMEKHESISQSYYRGSHFVLLVYSANDGTSLNKLKLIADNVRNYEPMAKLILVRNKTDLAVSADSVTLEREDSFVHNLNHRIHARFCTSAKNNEGIQHLLKELAKHALRLYKSGGKKPINYESDPFRPYLEAEPTQRNECCS